MSIRTKNPISQQVLDALTSDDCWETVYDWYEEVSRDCWTTDDEGMDFLDLTNHYTLAELRDLVPMSDEELLACLLDIYDAVERDLREAEEQDRWETSYWHNRDYRW